jgi:hypothetical protein
MTWFEDLTQYTYLGSHPTTPPTLNVGWLSRDRHFAQGHVPQRFVSRLHELCAHARTRQTRGLHACELCPVLNNDNTGSAEIRAVGANGTRYAAPTLILHYVTEHSYAPPQVFVEAVLRMHSLAWRRAEADQLCMSCGTALIRDTRMDGRLGVESSGAGVPCFLCAGCATTYWR